MFWVLLGVAVVLILVLVRAPGWVNAVILAASLLLGAGLMFISGAERAAAPLILFAVALGLLVPAGTPVARSARVAPRRRRANKAQAAAAGKVKVGEGFDAIEIPGYEILEKVGSGGMASVYRARRSAMIRPWP